jgi:hypothetical protein
MPGKKYSQTVGLLAMVAAMVHDYGHPQVNNAFLVDRVRHRPSPLFCLLYCTAL